MKSDMRNDRISSRGILVRLGVEVAGSIRRWSGLVRPASHRDILLISDNAMMAEYLVDVWELLNKDRRLHFYLLDYVNPAAKSSEVWLQIKKKLPLYTIKTSLAFLKHWDLIITADHTKPGLVDCRWGPTLRIPHGITSGRRPTTSKEAYTFGKYALNHQGQIRYSRMFENSEANREIAIRKNPQFRDVIAVVGNLHDDKLLDLATRRAETRQNLGFKPNDKVVFLLSTWGADSLFNTMGDAILSEARELIPEFEFILNVHPNEYQTKTAGERVWGEYLRTQKQYGFRVREIDEDWMPYLVASDVILSDHTSLALRAALLGRPIIQVPISDNVIEVGALSWRLKELTPKIKCDASDLGSRLREAIADYPMNRLQELARDINSYPGESVQRARREIYDLLKLELPSE